MVNKSIIDYINNSRKKGMSDKDIKSQLINVGWRAHDVIQAFKSLESTSLPEQKITPLSEPTTKSTLELVNATNKTNTLAIIALVMAFVIPLIGIILGFIALGKIKKSGEKGKGLAIAAIIIPIAVVLLYLGITILLAASGFMDFSKVMPERCDSAIDIPCQGTAAIYSDSVIIPLRNEKSSSITLQEYSVDGCSGEIIFRIGGVEQSLENAEIGMRESFSFETNGCDFGKTGDRAEINGQLKYVNTGVALPNILPISVVGMVS